MLSYGDIPPGRKKKKNTTKKQTQPETKIEIEVHNEASSDDETLHTM